MAQSPLIKSLIEAFRCLPGVGLKSASRMTYQLLERDRAGAISLAETLMEAMQNIAHCNRCRTFTETEFCGICENPKRDQSKLCVVETPSDVEAVEQTSSYRGLYFVLMGNLSPLDGIGPEDIGLSELAELLQKSPPKEVILALSSTVEGDATCHFIAQLINKNKTEITRIAQGVPMGGELEQIDGGTLAMSLTSRRSYE